MEVETKLFSLSCHSIEITDHGVLTCQARDRSGYWQPSSLDTTLFFTVARAPTDCSPTRYSAKSSFNKDYVIAPGAGNWTHHVTDARIEIDDYPHSIGNFEAECWLIASLSPSFQDQQQHHPLDPESYEWTAGRSKRTIEEVRINLNQYIGNNDGVLVTDLPAHHNLGPSTLKAESRFEMPAEHHTASFYPPEVDSVAKSSSSIRVPILDEARAPGSKQAPMHQSSKDFEDASSSSRRMIDTPARKGMTPKSKDVSDWDDAHNDDGDDNHNDNDDKNNNANAAKGTDVGGKISVQTTTSTERDSEDEDGFVLV